MLNWWKALLIFIIIFFKVGYAHNETKGPTLFRPIAMDKSIPAIERFAISPQGAFIVLSGGNAYDAVTNDRLPNSKKLTDISFTEDGVLWCVSGNRLGYFDGESFSFPVKLPGINYKLIGGTNRLFLIGPGEKGKSELFVIRKGEGYQPLFQVDGMIDAAAATPFGLIFASKGMIYEYKDTPPPIMNPVMCIGPKQRVRGVSLNAEGNTLYVACDSLIYVFGTGRVFKIPGSNIRGICCRNNQVFVLAGSVSPQLFVATAFTATTLAKEYEATIDTASKMTSLTGSGVSGSKSTGDKVSGQGVSSEKPVLVTPPAATTPPVKTIETAKAEATNVKKSDTTDMGKAGAFDVKKEETNNWIVLRAEEDGSIREVLASKLPPPAGPEIRFLRMGEDRMNMETSNPSLKGVQGDSVSVALRDAIDKIKSSDLIKRLGGSEFAMVVNPGKSDKTGLSGGPTQSKIESEINQKGGISAVTSVIVTPIKVSWDGKIASDGKLTISKGSSADIGKTGSSERVGPSRIFLDVSGEGQLKSYALPITRPTKKLKDKVNGWLRGTR